MLPLQAAPGRPLGCGVAPDPRSRHLSGLVGHFDTVLSSSEEEG